MQEKICNLLFVKEIYSHVDDYVHKATYVCEFQSLHPNTAIELTKVADIELLMERFAAGDQSSDRKF